MHKQYTALFMSDHCGNLGTALAYTLEQISAHK